MLFPAGSILLLTCFLCIFRGLLDDDFFSKMAMEEGADAEVRLYNSPGSLSGKPVPENTEWIQL